VNVELANLAPTLLGGALAIGGGMAGQWWAERRSMAREKRDREHEREVWARGLRVDAHLAFLTLFDERYGEWQSIRHGFGGSAEPPEDYLAPLWQRFQALRLVCSESTAKLAQKAMRSFNEYVFENGRWEQVEWDEDQYLGAIREELRLPPIPLMGDPDSE
jgi:hypothetical protein